MAAHGSGIVIALMFAASGAGTPPPDSALFNGDGQAEAYLSASDDMTIYLWDGEAVAYVQAAKGGGKDDVLGFNGKHLGWFSDDVIRGHDGTVACAEKSAMFGAVTEPVKPLKQLRPLKAFTEATPAAPTFLKSFGATCCGALLATGLP